MHYKLFILLIFITLVNNISSYYYILVYINKEKSAFIFTEIPDVLKYNYTFTENILSLFE